MSVTAAALASRLVERGMSADEREAKQSLFTGVIEQHAMLRGAAPAHVFWVPGRLEVFGKHTDYAGGRTLVSPVPRGFGVAVSPRTDRVVHVVDVWRGDSVTVGPSGAAPTAGWQRYVEVAVRRIARNFSGAEIGCDIVIASDLPRASGMSSSSALVIAIAEALVRTAALTRHPSWKTNIRSGLDAAGYYACIENGRDFAALRGDGGVGTHGGSEDHAAILTGRPGHVSAFAFVPARALGLARVPDTWRFVIAPSGVASRKTGPAREPYNRLSQGTSLLLEAWNREGPRMVSLAAALNSSPAAADRLRMLTDSAASAEMPAAWLRDRLQHFIREDARTLEALQAFERADARALGELAADSQRDAELLLGNQVPETSALAASARPLGAFAASNFGAGFGGAVWALVAAHDAAAFARNWHARAFVAGDALPLTDLSTS